MAVATRTFPPRRHATWAEQFGPLSITILLGAIMTLATVQSIVASNWARDLQVLISVALGGLLVGAVFAQVRAVPTWLIHSLSTVLGIAWAVERIGPLLGPALPTWKDQATELLIRSIILGRVIYNGDTGEDLLLFIAVLALLSWTLGYTTMWMLLRRRWAWPPVIINALTLLVNLTYASPKPPVILFYLFFGASLLLLVHQSYLSRSQMWSAAMIEFPDLLGWRFVASGALVVLVLLTITTLFPTQITSIEVAAVWQRVREPWQSIQERWDRAFSNINAPASRGGGGFAGRAVNLGGARSLGNNLLLEVKSQDGAGQTRADYWRATAYDQYTGNQDASGNFDPYEPTWLDTTGRIAAATLGVGREEQARTPLDANEQMPQLDTVDRELITQTFTLRESFAQPTLFAATQPVSVSIPIRVKHTFVAVDGRPVANYSDTSLIAAPLNGVQSGLSYTVVSSVSKADKQSLRNAPTQYPEWVQRYLQLPDGNQLQRVRDQAQVVAGAATNPYDKAEAIQNYLRTFPYQENIPSPPENRDRVDWFLFDLKQGYCEYYASAMVVMLRAQGVPARFVSGYAIGDLNPETSVYEVKQNVAHSWVEVYFPAYGWQRFEPTPASYTSLPERPEAPAQDGDAADATDSAAAAAIDGRGREIDLEDLERRLAELESGSEDAAQVRERIAAENARLQRVAWTRRGLVGAGVLAVLASGVFLLRRPRQMGMATFAYSRALRIAHWAGLGPQASATPREFALQLAEHMPAHRAPLNDIATAYTRERYSDGAQAKEGPVERAWQQVRWPLVGTMFSRWIGMGRRAAQKRGRSKARRRSRR